MNSVANISQSQVPRTNIIWQKIGSKVMQKISLKIHKTHNSIEEISIYFLSIFKHVKISQNNKKCIKKHIAIFWNFCKKIRAHRGSNNKNGGVHSNKFTKK